MLCFALELTLCTSMTVMRRPRSWLGYAPLLCVMTVLPTFLTNRCVLGVLGSVTQQIKQAKTELKAKGFTFIQDN